MEASSQNHASGRFIPGNEPSTPPPISNQSTTYSLQADVLAGCLGV